MGYASKKLLSFDRPIGVIGLFAPSKLDVLAGMSVFGLLSYKWATEDGGIIPNLFYCILFVAMLAYKSHLVPENTKTSSIAFKVVVCAVGIVLCIDAARFRNIDHDGQWSWLLTDREISQKQFVEGFRSSIEKMNSAIAEASELPTADLPVVNPEKLNGLTDSTKLSAVITNNDCLYLSFKGVGRNVLDRLFREYEPTSAVNTSLSKYDGIVLYKVVGENEFDVLLNLDQCHSTELRDLFV